MKLIYICSFLLFTITVETQPLYEKQIIPFDAMDTDHFGADIAINDSLLFISSLRYSNSIDACVYVYKFSNNDYVFESKIYPDDPEPLVLFGSKLYYQDGQLFVGARNKKINGFRTGALYVFEFENNHWIQKQIIIPPEPLISQKYFSEAIAKLNETLVIGAYRSDAGAEDNGKVFIYKHLNNQYILQQELAPYDPKDYQFFGNSLVLKDKLLLVSSHLDSTESGFESGSIYAYLKEDSVFTFSRKYIPQPNPPYLTLGTSMTSNDEYVFAGSAASFSYNFPGKVYIYKITEPLIDFHQIIESGEGYFNDRFGINMLAKGDTLLVTAFFDSVNNSTPGSVYMFVNENNFWTKKKKIVPSDEQTASLFGNSLAINDEIFFIGAPTSDISQEISCGKVYLFSSNPLSVFDDETNLVNEFVLHQNYPNPFNPATTIKYEIPERSNVILKVYNTLGQEIITLTDEIQSVGIYEKEFDGNVLSGGVYFYQLKAGSYVETKKMVLLK
jgi:hypothetical protein